MTPRRIRRERTPGWSRGDAVIVDRTSRFGNPFRVAGCVVVDPLDGRVWTCTDAVDARRWACDLYAAWLDGQGPDVYAVGRKSFDRRRILADLPSLAGRDLACPCPLPAPGEVDHCHAARTLLPLANPKGGAPGA